jgi:sarcosine/dimethylglycine N-methyltransferase
LTGAGGVYEDDPVEPGAHDNYGGPGLVGDLAQAAGVRGGDVVVDLGEGTGGPAHWMASHVGCLVVAVELLPARCRAIKAAAGAAGEVQVVAADATRLPLRAGVADVVVSIDGFLHIEAKEQLLAECRAVLRPGGSLAFTDWVAEPGLSPTERDLVVEQFGADGLGSVASYVQQLARAGFGVREVADLSLMWLLGVQAASARMTIDREQLEQLYGAALCERWADRYALLDRLGTAGTLGHTRIIATT